MYQYHPLNYDQHEIRILHLAPGQAEEPIDCKIVHVSLDNQPSYHALSYCWGNTTNPGTINLEGTDFSQDLVDRSEQVKFMRRIYEDAAMVNVWLGPETEDSSLAMSLIPNIGGLYSSEQAKATLKNCNGYRSLRALVELFRREYWQRTWVIQEFSLAKQITIHCGADSATRSGIEGVAGMALQWHAEFIAAMSDESGKALDALEGQSFMPSDYSTAYPGTDYSSISLLQTGGPVTLRSAKGSRLYRQGLASFDEKPQLLDCLLWHRFKEATNPRDKVYGLAGLSRGEGLLQSADYGLSVNQVYQNTVKYIVETTKCLNIICASRPGSDLEGLPSWTPDWRNPEFKNRSRDLYYSPKKFSAAASSSAEATFSSDTTILNARGFFLDTPISRAPRACLMSHPEDYDPVIEAFHDWHDIMVQIKGPDMQHCVDFCRALWGGSDEMIPDITLAAKIMSSFLIILDKAVENFQPTPALLMWEEQFKSPKNAEHWRNAQESFLGTVKACGERMQGKVFFGTRSDSKLCGIGPHHAESGDVLCVLLGCSYPVLLRQKGDKFVFIGEAYVEGLMLGEAMNKLMKDAPESPLTVEIGKDLCLDVLYDLQLC